MFQDTRATHDMINEFKEHISQAAETQRKMCGIDLCVNVLTTGYWPTQNADALPLPPTVQSACGVFKEFYLKKHNTRRLEFQTHMGHVDLRLHMPKKRYNLNVPVNMMVILMLSTQWISSGTRRLQMPPKYPGMILTGRCSHS